MDLLYIIFGILLIACCLFGIVFTLVYLSKREVAIYWLVMILLLGILVIFALSYSWVFFGLIHFNFENYPLLVRVLGIPPDYSDDIWFALFNNRVVINYSVLKVGLRSLSIIGGTAAFLFSTLKWIKGKFSKN